MKLFNLLQLSYENYSNAVRSYLSKTFSDFNNKYNNSTVFGQIITVVSSTIQSIMLYIEDAFTEQNKYTATRKKSIYGLAQLSGYNPSLGKAAGAQIKLSYIPTNASNLNLVIPNHTRVVCNRNGLTYNIILPQDAIVMSIDKDNTNKYLYCVEGVFESQRFISDGGKTYLLRVEFIGDIDEDFIEVRVNDELWDRADCLYDMEPGAKQWFYKTSILGGIILGFGNDVHGQSLKAGDEITVSYLRHNGEHGNINSLEHVKFMFVDGINDISGTTVDGNSVFNITLANQDSVSSGTFSEKIDDVKQMIGYNSRSLVLASSENYKVFINRFSFCGYNKTWSEPGSLIVNSLIMRNYKSYMAEGKDYFNLKEEDFKLSNSQKESIQRCITNSGRQLAGVTYNIFDPIIRKYALYIYIKPKSKVYDKDYITNQIRQTIGNFFGSITQDDYIPKSDITAAILNNVDDIDGVNCYFISEENETALIRGRYTKTKSTFNPSTKTYNKTTEDVYLYDGEDPGLGLDSHGNIYLENPEEYPVLMGGWRYISSKDKTTNFVNDPLIITFE